MHCPVFWLFAVEEKVYSPSLLTASWSRHLWPLLLFHPIPCLPYITTNFPRFSKQFLCLYFPASVISFSSNTSQFSGHFPFRNLQFHQKDIFFCLSVQHTSHTCYISLQALWAGLMFPLKQISNSNDSCYHLEISYVPGTVLNTWSIVTHLLPWNPDLNASLTQARAQGATVNCLRAQLSSGGAGSRVQSQAESGAPAHCISHEFLDGNNCVLFMFVHPMPREPQIFVEWIKIYNFLLVIQEKFFVSNKGF